MKKTGDKRKFSSIWQAVGLLLVFVLLSSHFSFDYMAKFVSKEVGESQAKVAKFSFIIDSDLTSPTGTLAVENMKPGDEFAYGVEIENQSEVAVRCTVQARNISGNLPLILNPVFKDLKANQVADFTYIVAWNESENSPQYMGQVDWIEFTVQVEQID